MGYATTWVAYTANIIDTANSGWQQLTADSTASGTVIAMFSLDGMSLEKEGYGRILEARVDEHGTTVKPTLMLYLVREPFATACIVGSTFVPATEDDVDCIETSMVFHYDNYVELGAATNFKSCWTRSGRAMKSLSYKTTEGSTSITGVLVAVTGTTIPSGNAYAIRLKIQKDS